MLLIKKYKELVLVTILLLLSTILLSYKLTIIPPGINFDESSIGYNASLISKSLHDENGRLLPVFVLTLDGKDWKQPVNIYFLAILFKVFGTSYFLLRYISVIYAIISGLLFYLLLRQYFKPSLSITGLILFILTPSIVLQSHLALENIALLPFIIGWLYFLLSYGRYKRLWMVLISSVLLGISFYSYKGMHGLVPVYILASLLYLFFPITNLKISELIKKIKPLVAFCVGLLPFILPIKWLQVHYAGAVFDPNTVGLPSFHEALNVYLSSFDFSFLFVHGDKMLVHSTQQYGMFIFPIFILFFLGIVYTARNPTKDYLFIIFVLLLSPLPLVLVGSLYRASRLMMYVPLILFISILGIKLIIEYKHKFQRNFIIICLFVFTGIQSVAFLRYYWNEYPKLIVYEFSPNINSAVRQLSEMAIKLNKKPYIEKDDYYSHKQDYQFYSEVYLSKMDIKLWDRNKGNLPADGLLLTPISGSNGLKTMDTIVNYYSGQKQYYLVGVE